VADIEDAVAQGAETFDDVKRLTRAGMGLCQAKTCHTVVNTLIAELAHKPMESLPASRLRIPIRLIAMAALAKAQLPNEQEK